MLWMLLKEGMEKEKIASREMGPLSKGSIESSLETGSPTKFRERLTRIWHQLLLTNGRIQ